MEYCGYFLAHPSKEILDKNKNKWLWLNFDALHQEDNTEEIKNNFKILFHLTPKYNIEKIKHLGLSPRSKNSYLKFPHRIYFIFPDFTNWEDLENEIMSLGQNLSDENKSQGNNGEYCLITIDLSEIGENVHFYPDPNYEFGCFTNDYIKPNAIINIDNLKFNLH